MYFTLNRHTTGQIPSLEFMLVNFFVIESFFSKFTITNGVRFLTGTRTRYSPVVVYTHK